MESGDNNDNDGYVSYKVCEAMMKGVQDRVDTVIRNQAELKIEFQKEFLEVRVALYGTPKEAGIIGALQKISQRQSWVDTLVKVIIAIGSSVITAVIVARI